MNEVGNPYDLYAVNHSLHKPLPALVRPVDMRRRVRLPSPRHYRAFVVSKASKQACPQLFDGVDHPVRPINNRPLAVHPRAGVRAPLDAGHNEGRSLRWKRKN